MHIDVIDNPINCIDPLGLRKLDEAKEEFAENRKQRNEQQEALEEAEERHRNILVKGVGKGKNWLSELTGISTEISKIKDKIRGLDEIGNVLAYEILERIQFNITELSHGTKESELEGAWESAQAHRAWRSEVESYNGGDTTLAMIEGFMTVSGIGAVSKLGVHLTAATVKKLFVSALAKAVTKAEQKLLNNQLAHLMQVSMAGVPANMSDDMVTLFRTVGKSELDDIASNGFRNIDSQMGAKWFAESADDAAEWARKFFKWDKDPKFLIKTTVPKDLANKMFRNPKLDGIGAARSATDDILKEINTVGTKPVEIPTLLLRNN